MRTKRIDSIVRILKKHEDGLSDGFSYYTPFEFFERVGHYAGKDRELGTRYYLEEIAEEILNELDK